MGLLAACPASPGRPNGALREIHSPQAPGAGDLEAGEYVTGRCVARLGLPGIARSFTVAGNVLYAFMNQAGLAAIDISNPEAPRLACHIPGPAGRERPTGGYYYAGLVEPGRLLVADRVGGLAVFDTTDPLRPVYRWTLPLPGGRPIQLTRSGDLYYIAAGEGGLYSLPAAFDAHTTPTALLRQFDYVKQVTVYHEAGVAESGKGNWLLLADSSICGLQVLDATDPRRPRPVQMFNTGSSCDALEAFDGVAALSNRQLGLMLLDLTQPARPYLVSSFWTHPITACRCLARLGGDRLLVGYQGGFFDVIGLRDPRRPAWLARIPARGGVTCLATAGPYAFTGLSRPISVTPDHTGDQLSVYRLSEHKR